MIKNILLVRCLPKQIIAIKNLKLDFHFTHLIKFEFLITEMLIARPFYDYKRGRLSCIVFKLYEFRSNVYAS